MKINEMWCPNCGHCFYTDWAYGRCDACGTVFYASASKRPQQEHPRSGIITSRTAPWGTSALTFPLSTSAGTS